MIGLYIGRFQPFHNGHKAVCEYIANEVDELIVGIGSSQLSHEPDHPFTAEERNLMITRALPDLRIPFRIVLIPDVHSDELWVSHVCSLVPSFDVVYSTNPLVMHLFAEAGFEVRAPPMFERGHLSGTYIRKCMVEGKSWESFVPAETATVIREIDGESRVQSVSGSR
ncbi:MAG TPA: nicotinamide-nucleotide adenylyltransferase [Methanocorpusculum sp.]|nr:nicotinamide-nucleotide adenylyltransferase [Methanocorpusculum sp.]